jgi:hypothetical protein
MKDWAPRQAKATIDTYAWARILSDVPAIAAMSDAEFAEFWTALGRAVRVASRAASRPRWPVDEATDTPRGIHLPGAVGL